MVPLSRPQGSSARRVFLLLLFFQLGQASFPRERINQIFKPRAKTAPRLRQPPTPLSDSADRPPPPPTTRRLRPPTARPPRPCPTAHPPSPTAQPHRLRTRLKTSRRPPTTRPPAESPPSRPPSRRRRAPATRHPPNACHPPADARHRAPASYTSAALSSCSAPHSR